MKDVTVMYLRLSKEDESIKDESNSISNQRILLRRFIADDKKMNDTEIIEVKDDGFSGKNMDRPGMTRLLEMIRRRQVQNIIVKDFSRFARDYLVLGKYVEQIFPFMGIRFVSVSDNYDSDRFEGGIVTIDEAFKALLYDFYSEDLSIKVKSSLRMRRDSRKYIATFAPYGYRKSKTDRYRLEVDPAAADIVKMIFKEYADGKTMYSIANELNKNEIPWPAKYIIERDNVSCETGAWKGTAWGVVAISRILHNETYLGVTVYDRCVEAEVGKRATICKPKENWARNADTHDALVDKELFDKVQARLANNKKPEKKYKKAPLAGLVKCGGCGYSMMLSRGGRPKFACNHKYRLYDKEADKCAPSIRQEDLEKVILNMLKGRMKDIKDQRAIIQDEKDKRTEKENAVAARLSSMNNSYNRINDDQLSAYESYREGRIDRDTYIQQKNAYEEMLKKLGENIARQQDVLNKIEAEAASAFKWADENEHVVFEKLDRELALTLIDKVVIGSAGEIEIIWKFNK